MVDGLFYFSFFSNTPELNPLRAHTKLSSCLNSSVTKLQATLNCSSHVALIELCPSQKTLLKLAWHTPLRLLMDSN